MAVATIHDVARRAKVGIGTVSRVLNNHPSVSDTTRKRVRDAILELNYSPHPMARRLSMGRTLTIAVVAPFFTRPSYVERLRGVHTVLAESQYEFVLYNIDTPEAWASYLQKPLGQERYDGLLIMTLRPDALSLRRLQGTGMPIVFIDCDEPGFNRVVVDDVAGGRMATQHLLDLGHRQIAFLGDDLGSAFYFVANLHRLQGYQAALKASGIEFRPDYHRQGNYGVSEAEAMTYDLLDLPDPPTAIFAASDTQAIGVLAAAEQRGLAVPGDLSVIGYDDIEIAEYLHLTTIRQPLFTSGVEGVERLLISLDGGKPEDERLELPIYLVERETTGPPHCQ